MQSSKGLGEGRGKEKQDGGGGLLKGENGVEKNAMCKEKKNNAKGKVREKEERKYLKPVERKEGEEKGEKTPDHQMRTVLC